MRKHPWLTAIIAIIVLFAVMYYLAEWLGELRWQQYAREARARGEKILLTEFARPEIPDAQNFAALPMMRAAFAGGAATKFELPKISGDLPAFGDPVTGKGIDWMEWQKHFQTVGFLTEPTNDPIRDVLRALEHFAPQFQEWSEWRTRPQCRFPLDLSKGFSMPMNHLGTFQAATKIFLLRMRAHLALGDSAAAYTDFQDGLQAYRALRDEPTLILGLVRLSALYLVSSGVGEGLRNHAWTERDLQTLESDLAAIQVWDDYRLALDSERGALNTHMQSLLQMSRRDRGRTQGTYWGATRGTGETIFYTLLPTSVIRDNQIRMNRYAEELEARVGPTSHSLDLVRKTPSSPENITDTTEQYYYFMARMSAPVYRTIEDRYIRMQTHLDQARLAIALERFRLAHGTYPAALEELVPKFIAAAPSDIYAGAPYHYQRTATGSFQLYGVGKDRHDDGGQIDPKKPEKNQADVIGRD